MARAGREFFYFEDHLIQDAAIHDSVVEGGDDAKARKVSNDVAKRIGLTDAEIAALNKKSAK
jgi:hypothetical protein